VPVVDGRGDTVFHFTVHAYSRMKYTLRDHPRGFHFVLDRSHAMDDAFVRSEVAKCLEHQCRWEDFVIPWSERRLDSLPAA
jgi:hypothetical protein